MKNYEEMSDFEINKAVALIIGVSFNDDGEPVRFVECDTGSYADFNEIEFDPCNNPEDAWPIIVDSKISLHHSICKWDADSLVYDKKYKNGFFIFSSCSAIGDISSRGALRAAMIVFLKMNEEGL
ncbi:hypothetical protein ASO78B_053 [Escherichia phage vB_EcoS_ASO78B]|nr:hypothetical protein ASO78B_053 [Escherichia phage vB_EcoS_ASO78B]